MEWLYKVWQGPTVTGLAAALGCLCLRVPQELEEQHRDQQDKEMWVGHPNWPQPPHQEAKISPTSSTNPTADLVGLWFGHYHRTMDTRGILFKFFSFCVSFSFYCLVGFFVFFFRFIHIFLFYSMCLFSLFPQLPLDLVSSCKWTFLVCFNNLLLSPSFFLSHPLLQFPKAHMIILSLPALLQLYFSSSISLFYLLNLLNFPT